MYGCLVLNADIKKNYVQNFLNVLNEDTNVAGDHGLYPHSWRWHCKRTVEDRASGRLRAKDASEIIAYTLS